MTNRLTAISEALTVPLKGNRPLYSRSSSQIDKQDLFQTVFPKIYHQYVLDVYKLVRDNLALFSQTDIKEQLRPQQRQRGSRQAVKFLKTMKLDMEKEPERFSGLFYGMFCFGPQKAIKNMVHYFLYLKSLLIFQSNEYHRQVIKDANNGKDLGCFGLTQFYHGSFSRGIQTVAVYDHIQKQFVITSNGERGMKFWIGNAWLTASMSVIWAQLIVDGKNYGPHPFVVRIRDRETHQAMPGVILLDCGPKNGMNLLDNGGIKLDNFRVSRESLLGRLGFVDHDGKYISEIQSNAERFGRHMSPLSCGRALISQKISGFCMLTLAIGLRYVTQRSLAQDHQDSSRSPERLLIDYPLMKVRLLVPLAQTMVYFFGGFSIGFGYLRNLNSFMDPTKTIVSELHAISAVTKTKSSTFLSNLLTEVRSILGEHGYSAYSRLGDMYHANDVNLTGEGDNNLLLQQTTKFLLKFLPREAKGELIDLSFVHQNKSEYSTDDQSMKCLKNLGKILQSIFITKYLQTRNKQMQSQKDQFEQWNELQPFYGNELALSFGDVFYFSEAMKAIDKHSGPIINRKYLEKCIMVWLYSVFLKEKAGDIAFRKKLQQLIMQGCEELYPECLSVVDTLVSPSYISGSPFAKEDGPRMEAYLEMILNKQGTFQMQQWMRQIPIMRGQL